MLGTLDVCQVHVYRVNIVMQCQSQKGNEMSRSYHNIEASAFRKGQYVGYSVIGVFRIVKMSGVWRASPLEPTKALYGFARATLSEVSRELESIK